jgi:hypothetical protein
MKSIQVLFLLLIITPAGFAQGSTQKVPKGFTSLFNGKNFTQWKVPARSIPNNFTSSFLTEAGLRLERSRLAASTRIIKALEIEPSLLILSKASKGTKALTTYYISETQKGKIQVD